MLTSFADQWKIHIITSQRSWLTHHFSKHLELRCGRRHCVSPQNSSGDYRQQIGLLILSVLSLPTQLHTMWWEECRFYLIPSPTHLFSLILTAIRILRWKNRAVASVNHFIFCWIALTNLFQHFSDFFLSSVLVFVVVFTLAVVEEKKGEE